MKPKDFHLLSPSIIFPLKEGNPKDHRPDVFLVSPSMCFFPLNTQGLEPCLRFTKIFESRREPVEKQGETRFKTVNLVNTGESQMANNRFPNRIWQIVKQGLDGSFRKMIYFQKRADVVEWQTPGT